MLRSNSSRWTIKSLEEAAWLKFLINFAKPAGGKSCEDFEFDYQKFSKLKMSFCT